MNKLRYLGVVTDFFFSTIDNLAVSAQGFRRGANRVRKVSLIPHHMHKRPISYDYSFYLIEYVVSLR
jgi:hypothetical protein